MESRRRQSPPPSKAARFSVAELGLGLGPGSRRSSGFTFMQLQELEQQALIFHHIAAGLPVPFHLVLPIWKSVAASSPFASHRSFPSFMGCSDFDCGGTDAEPGRCRRTDGKKWRCSKPVILNQKYCERHVHRGRHRARKLAGDAAGETSLAAESTAHFSGGGRISSSTMHGFSPISVLPDGAEDGSS